MAQARRQPMRIRPQVEELEPRVLYSADLPLSLGPVAGNAETRLIDSAPSTAQLADNQVARRELVVIDAGIADADALLASLGLDAGRADILRLGAGSDGIAELGAALCAYDGLQTLHILAHGDAGLLNLGTSRLDGLEMVARADEVAAWGAALDADADILVYGCDVGRGEAGAAWVDTLASLTGADVAASDDATGAAGLGGDWRLEYRAGAIDDHAVLAAVEPEAWQGLLYANNFTYRREISVPTVDGTHLDFPMLVSGTYASLATTGNGGHVENANGYDIIFTADAAGTNILDHEIEAYDPTTGQVALWVRVPTLASGATIYMFYGNAAVTSSQEDISGTWDASYRGVWHLNESGTGAAGEYQDSSANANHGDGGGATPNSAPAQTAGRIGAAQDFTASEGDFIHVADDVSLNITGSLTLEAWINGDSWAPTSGNNVVLARQFGTDILDAYNLLVNASPTSTSQLSSFVYGYEVTGGSLSANTWYHVAATYTSNSAVLYVNGMVIVTQTGAVTFANDANPLLIGANENTPTNIPSSYFDGVIDEVRLSASARSTQWIATSYANQNNPAAFYVLGAETSSQAPTASNLNAPETYVEDTPLDLTDIVVADPDSANLSVTLTLSNAAAGALSTATAGTTTSTYASGLWSASGPIADLNTLLAGLSFTPALNYNAAFSIATSVSDGANTLTGGKAMTGTPAADPPVINSNGGGATASTSIGENSTAVTTVQAIDPDVPAQPIAYSISGGADAALFQIDAASGALSFVTAPNFENPADQDANNVYEVTVRASDPGTGFDEQALSVQVTNVNDAPVITAPASFALYQNQEYVFSGANAIQIADADINTGFLDLRLEVGHGTLHLASTSGITFSQGANGQNMMRFNGTLANVNAALNGMLYRPASGYTGLDNLAIVADDQGNSGGPAQSATRNVAINVLSANSALLWLTADGNVDVPGYAQTIDNSQVFSFSEPNLVFEPGTTSGQFDVPVSLGIFPGSANTDVSGIHLVTRAVSVAGTLLARGDLLFTVDGNVNFNGVTADPQDLVRFQPTSPDYSTGVFSLLLDNPFSENLREIALVEQTVTVGDITLNPGDFLMVHQSPAYHNDIRRFVATGTGAATAGTFSMLVDGEDIDLNSQIGGLHLVQESTRLGNTTLSAGRLLLSMRNNDDVGDNNPPVDVTKYDIFVLNITDAGDTTAATATLLFQGADVGLDSNSEALHGISIVIPNFAPILSGANNLGDIPEDTPGNPGNSGSLVTDLLVSHISDPDGDPAGIAVTSADNAHGAWQYSTDGSTWNAFGAQSATASRLLAADASTRIRFVPNADWNGSSSITFRAWDRTAGTAGATADTTLNGGFTPFSLSTASSNISVTPVNDAPEITSNGGGATAALDRAENTASVTTVTASDAELPAQTLTYSLIGGADMARFQIGASSGVLSFVAPLPDYELPGDANQDNIYQVTVQVADGNGGVDSQSLSITLQDVDDTTTLYLDGDTTPPFSDFSTAVPTGATLVNFDPARDSQPGLLIAKGGDNLGANQTDDSRHHTWVLAGPVNILSDPVRLLLWSDMKDGMNAAQTTDVAQGKAGSVTAYLLDLASATAETGGTVIASATVSDSSWGDGYAWEQKTFDFGTVNYNVAAGHFLAVKIVVNDASGDDLWFAYDTAALASRLIIGGTNQAPVITSNGGGATATQNVNENATLATTVTATDADTPTLSYGIVGGTDAARFGIHPTTGVLNFVSPPDYENPNDANADRIYNVIVQVSDGAGGTDSQTLDVTVQPLNEAAPVIASNGGGASASITVNENTPAVTTVTATDTDLPAPNLTYSVSGTDAARFSINPTTGVLTFASAPDYEAPTDNGGNNVYNIVVQVSDGTLTDTQALTVSVVPLNDNSPIIGSNGGGATATVSVNENTTAVTTVTATDADQPPQTLTYSIVGGADAARFQIVKLDDGHAVLSFNIAPNHEIPIDANGDNVYEVVVQVSDGNGTDSQVISVTVADTHEPFVVNNDLVDTNEETAALFNVIANDFRPDDTLTVLDYTLPTNGSITLAANGAGSYVPGMDFNGVDSFHYIVRGDNTPDDRTHYWRLDGNATDSIGSANGTLSGPDLVTGRYGYGLDFNGTSDYVALPDIAYNNSFSLSFWFRIENNSGYGYDYLLSHSNYDSNNNINVYTLESGIAGSAGVLRTALRDGNDGTDITDLDVNLQPIGVLDGNWHSYTLVVNSAADDDGNHSFVYIDGVRRQEDDSGGDAINPAGSLYLGRNDSGESTRYFDGGLDALQIYNRALTSTEVANLHSGTGVTGTVNITVQPVNDAPSITSDGRGDNAALNRAENTPIVTTVTASDIDTPTASLTYSLVSGGDSGRFQINTSSGVLSFLAAPDYEAPSDANADNVYNVTVQVSDGAGGSDTQAIAVTVTPVNDNNPVITSNGGGASADVNVAENTLAVTTVTATDADLPAQTLTYAITGGADAARFYINPSTGALSFQIAPDYEAPSDANTDNTYVVTVRVRDPSGLEDTQTLNVHVTPVNDNPPVMTYNGGNRATVNVDENTTHVVTLTASDLDQPPQTLTFRVASGLDAARFQIDPNTGVLGFITAPDYDIPGDANGNNIYAVDIEVSDGASTDTQTIWAQIRPVNDNEPDIASNGGGATATINHRENERQVTIVTATDQDQPSQTLTYGIVPGGDAALFEIDAGSGILRFRVAPDYEAPVGGDNTYQVTVRASDGALWDDQVLTIQVQDNDDTRVTDSEDIDPRPDRILEDAIPGTGVGITARATDPDTSGDIAYSLENDAGGRFAIDNLSGVVSLLGGIDYETASSHYIEVRATSPDSTFSLTGFVIAVLPVNDREPAIDSDGGGDTADVGVPENTAYVTTVTAEDADEWPAGTSSALVYRLSGGADAGRFAIDATSGVLSFLAAPDYEAPGDANADNVYEVIVEVSDGLYGDTQRLNVSVTPDNDNPPVFVTTRLYIDEGQTAVGQIVATDADLPAQTLRYFLVGGDDRGLFELTLSGSLSFLAAPNYEEPTDTDGDNVYDIAVRVEDGAGPAVLRNIAIEVRALNDNAPVITSDGGGATAVVAVNENSTAVTRVQASDADLPPQELTYSIVGGVDANLFSINPSGDLTFLAAPDFETPADANLDNVYVVIVQASDGSLSDTQTLSVTITPVNDNPPIINTPNNGDPAELRHREGRPQVTDIDASDADWLEYNVTRQALTYSIAGGADAARFQIDAATGLLSFIDAPVFATPADANGDNVYEVTVQVSDGTADGPGTLSDTQALRISIFEGNDFDPVIEGGASAAFTLDENGVFATTVRASDADVPAQTLTYGIAGGTDAGRFGIDAQSGVLTLNLTPDFEAPADSDGDNVYQVIVQVSDGRGGSATQAISVAVRNVNEAPETTGITDQLAKEGEPFSLAVAGAFSDPDAGDRLTYSVSGLPAWLRFDAASATFSGTPGVEDATETPLNIVVTATDPLGLTVSAGFALSVGDINIAPVGVADTYQGDEDSRIEGNVLGNDRDLDKDALSATLLSGPSHGRLSFNADGSFVYTPDADFNGNDGFIYQAGDGELVSAPTSVSLLVLPVNDAPVITANGLSVTGGGSITLSPANLAAADVDGGGNLTFVVVAVSGGQFEFAERPGQPVSSFSQADIAAGKVLFVSTDSAQRPAFTLQAGDGQTVSTPSQGGVDFTPMILVDTGAGALPPTGSGTPSEEKPSDKPSDRKEGAEEVSSDTGDSLVDAAQSLARPIVENTETAANIVRALPQTLTTAVNAVFSQTLATLASFQTAPVVAPFQLAETQMALLESMQIEALDALKNSFGNDTYSKALDQMRQTLEREATLQHVVIGSSVALSGGLSIGYVLWLLRGGALLGSLLSAMPAWTLLDPVPVLAYYMKQDKGAASDKTERMFEKATAAKGKTIWARIKGMRR